MFIFLTLVSSTEEGHIFRPPPGEEEFLAILFFAIMMTLLTTPGFQLKKAARLDGAARRGGKLAWEERPGESKKKKTAKEGERSKVRLLSHIFFIAIEIFWVEVIML